MSERTIKSHDGTQIVYEQHGQGPPLVLVHSGFVDRTIWGHRCRCWRSTSLSMRSTGADMGVATPIRPITILNRNMKT